MVAEPGLPLWQDEQVRWRPQSIADREFDVLIVGGGFTGLWTAYQLVQRWPDLAIAVLEREHFGFGASGRNGGFAMTKLGVSLSHLVNRFGPEATREMHLKAVSAVESVIATVEREQIDCDLDHGGLLLVGANEVQERRVRREFDMTSKLDLPGAQLLEGDEVRKLVASPTYRVALREEHCAVLHPYRLVVGLADKLQGRGVKLLDGIAVGDIHPGPRGISIGTSAGSFRAEQVVLATNAWTVERREFRRKILVVYSYVIATDPIPDDLWAEIGWQGREGIEDKRSHLQYYRRTRDNRIVFGGREAVNTFRGKVAPRYDASTSVRNQLEEGLRATFPQLSSIGISHHWGGPTDITTDFLPTIGTMPGGRVHYGFGLSGHGVASSHFVAELLADRVLDVATRGSVFTRSDRPANFPPEPLNSASVYLARKESVWWDRRADEGQSTVSEPLLLKLGSRLLSRWAKL
jgi:glycine/D-amino acid oxidase-like deaminating enzyme